MDSEDKRIEEIKEGIKTDQPVQVLIKWAIELLVIISRRVGY